MKLHCNKCQKQLTSDLYPVKVVKDKDGWIQNKKDVWEIEVSKYYDPDEDEYETYEFGVMKRGVFYVNRKTSKWNNKWDEDRPAQIILGKGQEIVVGKLSILDGIIPEFMSGYGCCNYSMGKEMKCECGNTLGRMYLDCYEDGSLNFIEKSVRRGYK